MSSDKQSTAGLGTILFQGELVRTFFGLSQYSRPGLGASACGLAAMNCVRLVLGRESIGVRDVRLLGELLGRDMMDDILRICVQWTSPSHLDVDDILKAPIFENTLTLSDSTYATPTLENFRDLLQRLKTVNDAGASAAVITRPPEIITCMKIPAFGMDVFVIFDSHPRPNKHPNGAAFLFFTTLEKTARYLSDLLQFDHTIVADPELQWQAQLLANYSAHIFVARDAPELPSRWAEAMMESSLSTLAMKSEVEALRTKNRSLEHEHTRFVNGLRTKWDSLRVQNLQLIENMRSEMNGLVQQNNSLRGEEKRLRAEVKRLSGQLDSVSGRDPHSADQTLLLTLSELFSSGMNPFRGSSNAPRQLTKTPSSRRNAPSSSKLPPNEDDFTLAARLQVESQDAASRDGVSKAPSSRRNFLSSSKLPPNEDDFILVPRLQVESQDAASRDAVSKTPSSRRHFPSSSKLPSNEDDFVVAARLQVESQDAASRDAVSKAPSSRRSFLSSSKLPPDEDDFMLAARLQAELQDAASRDSVYAATLQRQYESERVGLQQQQKSLLKIAPSTRRNFASSSKLPSVEDDFMLAARLQVELQDAVSRDSVYAATLQRQYESEHIGLQQQQKSLLETVPSTFDCGICLDKCPEEDVATFQNCSHLFCRDCERGYIRSKLEDGRFPIFCPTCMAANDKNPAGEHGVITEDLVQQIGLTEKEYAKFEEYQLAEFSVILHCRRCKNTLFVDKQELQATTTIVCPLPGCAHVWCKSCSQTIEGDAKHSCDGSSELKHLAQEKGWKYCPGCQTLIEKNLGCNHMTCTSPGCNTHFCYVCGGSIVRSVKRKAIQTAIEAHYRTCKLFEYD
ncbi:hypothetical protein JAAARDRAFT_34527 [Jaapia argillacea MUCL 33604]|uniref:RBR-type E3 ubiquitin transferase n=1 Tax=Jaapia argillacea MUCL 33604 TaxID=933084 RepID=A0A067PXS8_9AGAM|nr:hypothetical protein JAAARDRAFT_34527 [Jaapia argillacea MUCL 33604]